MSFIVSVFLLHHYRHPAPFSESGVASSMPVGWLYSATDILLRYIQRDGEEQTCQKRWLKMKLCANNSLTHFVSLCNRRLSERQSSRL